MRKLKVLNKVCLGCGNRWMAIGFHQRGRKSCSPKCETTLRNKPHKNKTLEDVMEQREIKRNLEIVKNPICDVDNYGDDWIGI